MPSNHLLADPLGTGGFLTGLRNLVAEFRHTLSEFDEGGCTFESALEMLPEFTKMLSLLISDIGNGDIPELFRLSTDFNGLVAEFSQIISETDWNSPEFDSTHGAFQVVHTEYQITMIQLLVALHRLEFAGIIAEIGGNGTVNDYVPRVPRASEGTIQHLEKVMIGVIEKCSICLEKLPAGSDATRLPCSHQFHGDCIEQWLETSGICPLCRTELPCY